MAGWCVSFEGTLQYSGNSKYVHEAHGMWPYLNWYNHTWGCRKRKPTWSQELDPMFYCTSSTLYEQNEFCLWSDTFYCKSPGHMPILPLYNISLHWRRVLPKISSICHDCVAHAQMCLHHTILCVCKVFTWQISPAYKALAHDLILISKLISTALNLLQSNFQKGKKSKSFELFSFSSDNGFLKTINYPTPHEHHCLRCHPRSSLNPHPLFIFADCWMLLSSEPSNASEAGLDEHDREWFHPKASVGFLLVQVTPGKALHLIWVGCLPRNSQYCIVKFTSPPHKTQCNDNVNWTGYFFTSVLNAQSHL